MPSSIGSFIAQSSNNTSACSSLSDLSGNLLYCGAFFEGSSTNPLNSSAETLTPNSPAGHVSDISLHQLMYPGWTGRMICEYQPWFGSLQHISVGYNENDPRTVAAQNSAMITEGCDINLVDFYGAISPSQTFNLATTNLVFSDLNTRTGQPLKFGILEDKGLLLTPAQQTAEAWTKRPALQPPSSQTWITSTRIMQIPRSIGQTTGSRLWHFL